MTEFRAKRYVTQKWYYTAESNRSKCGTSRSKSTRRLYTIAKQAGGPRATSERGHHPYPPYMTKAPLHLCRFEKSEACRLPEDPPLLSGQGSAAVEEQAANGLVKYSRALRHSAARNSSCGRSRLLLLFLHRKAVFSNLKGCQTPPPALEIAQPGAQIGRSVCRVTNRDAWQKIPQFTSSCLQWARARLYEIRSGVMAVL